jgi:hypothetical protein
LAWKVSTAPAFVGSGETESIVTDGAAVSFVTVEVAEDSLPRSSATQTRRSFEPSARSPAAMIEATVDGLVV